MACYMSSGTLNSTNSTVYKVAHKFTPREITKNLIVRLKSDIILHRILESLLSLLPLIYRVIYITKSNDL